MTANPPPEPLTFNEIEQRHAEKKAILAALIPGTYPHDMEWLLDYARAATERAARLEAAVDIALDCEQVHFDFQSCPCGNRIRDALESK